MLEDGITAYDTNVRSGGEGARYLGIDISREYRVDQVTVKRLWQVAGDKAVLDKYLSQYQQP